MALRRIRRFAQAPLPHLSVQGGRVQGSQVCGVEHTVTCRSPTFLELIVVV